MPAWSGMFNSVFPGGHTLIQKLTNRERQINRLLSTPGGRKLRATLLALTGAAPGQSKVVTGTRIAADASGGLLAGSGKRTIETVTYQAGVTTNADLTRIDTNLNKRSKPTYVKDKAITKDNAFNRNNP